MLHETDSWGPCTPSLGTAADRGSVQEIHLDKGRKEEQREGALAELKGVKLFCKLVGPGPNWETPVFR